jgi:hypothetical protein
LGVFLNSPMGGEGRRRGEVCVIYQDNSMHGACITVCMVLHGVALRHEVVKHTARQGLEEATANGCVCACVGGGMVCVCGGGIGCKIK